ncbi:MAG TPA: HAD-IA family hydrolase [Candidatus Saccharimonadales bacterium]|nr:HAD-IA family hydrolase [Candidatus Saccharimonadales bacterium]
MDERGLGKKLQKARQAAGLTQQQLCQQANLSFSTLTKIERGAIKAPSIFTIQAIAGALGVGLDELIGASPAPHRQLKKTRSGASFIYFDMNGCLVHSYQAAFVKLASDTGVSPDVIESVYWRYNDDVCRGRATLAEFNEELAKKAGVKKVDWLQYYLDVVEQIPEMHEILVWAASHYKVGLLTNTMPGFVSALRRKGLIPDIHYDAIVDSSEIGVLKPEQEIYAIAEERAGISPEEILFIDDAKANLVAASKLGWNVMWFDDARPETSATTVRQALEPADV